MSGKYKVGVCIWRDLSLAQAEELLRACQDFHAMQNTLSNVLSAQRSLVAMTTKQSLIEVDLYSHVVLFSKKLGLEADQLSALFSIVKDVHSLCVSTAHDNTADAVKLFKELVVCHSVSRPPYSVGLFSLAQAKAITDYVLSTYFKHFKLYKFAYTKQLRLDVVCREEELTFDPSATSEEKPLETEPIING